MSAVAHGAEPPLLHPHPILAHPNLAHPNLAHPNLNAIEGGFRHAPAPKSALNRVQVARIRP